MKKNIRLISLMLVVLTVFAALNLQVFAVPSTQQAIDKENFIDGERANFEGKIESVNENSKIQLANNKEVRSSKIIIPLDGNSQMKKDLNLTTEVLMQSTKQINPQISAASSPTSSYLVLDAGFEEVSGKMRGYVKWESTVGKAPTTVNLTMAFYYGISRYGSYTKGQYATLNGIKKGTKNYLTYTPSTTKFWQLSGVISSYTDVWSTRTFDAPTIVLANKKCVFYPKVYGKGGNLLPEPSRTDLAPVDKSKRASYLSTSQKTEYKKSYAKTYGIKASTLDSDTEIHHIIPIRFGGTNPYSNLIPLSYNDHRKKVSPWWSNYWTGADEASDPGCGAVNEK